MEIKHENVDFVNNYNEAAQEESFKIVTDNNIDTKLIGYMLGVNESALEVAVVTHIEPASYAVIGNHKKLTLNHPNPLIVDHYQKLFEVVCQQAEISDLSESQRTSAVIEMLSGKFDVIIFKSTSKVNLSLNRKGKKFYFVYPTPSMREICLKQAIDDGIRTDDYMQYAKNFENAIGIIDNEIGLFMVKLKFDSYTNLSLRLMNELKI